MKRKPRKGEIFDEKIPESDWIRNPEIDVTKGKNSLVRFEKLQKAIQQEDLKKHAIEFAEWLQNNRWFTFQNGKWYYTFEGGTSISEENYNKNYVKTSEEIYELYQKSKKK